MVACRRVLLQAFAEAGDHMTGNGRAYTAHNIYQQEGNRGSRSLWGHWINDPVRTRTFNFWSLRGRQIDSLLR